MIVACVAVLALPLPLLDIMTDGHRYIALELFDLAHNFELSRRVEDVPLTPQEQLQMPGDIAAANIDALDGVVDGVTLEDRRAVAAAISAVEHETRCAALSIQ